MKKIIAGLLICISAVALLAGCDAVSPTPTENVLTQITPNPAETPISFLQTDDGWRYTIENNEAIIYGYNGEATEAVIPSQIAGFNVTTLDTVALCRKTKVLSGGSRYVCDLTSVTIPSTVKNIPIDVFAYGDDLTNVIFEADSNFTYVNNVLYSKDMTILYLCVSKNIEAFTIPDTVKTIAGGAFRACRKLTSITIPSNVETIGDNAFYNCSAIKTITIEEGVKSIYSEAFSRCINLEKLILPRSINAIAYRIVSFTDDLEIWLYKDSYVDTFFNENSETFGEGAAFADYCHYFD